jgi:hypothetical protein
MTDTTHGWPGKHGVPLNPEKDSEGHVWRIDGVVDIFKWIAAKQAHENAEQKWFLPEDVEWCFAVYHGRITPPDEAAALQARVAELRQIIRYVAGCEHATASDEDLLEQVAAAICRMNKIDPTGHISIDGSPFDWAWKHFLPQARAALGETQ